MNNNHEPSGQATATRRKFLRGLSLLTAFSAMAAWVGHPLAGKKNAISCIPEPKKKMVKMLTEDGRLVEVEASLLRPGAKRASTDEMQHWVKKQLK